MIPPHGYVKMKMWVKVPIQVKDANAPTKFTVSDQTTNLDGRAWVFHCHILRHEDRGMMMIVKPEDAAR